MQSADVVIVGGGIWGLSIAYHLVRCGQSGRIVVLERGDRLAAETTSQAAGQIGQIRSDRLMMRGVAATCELLERLRDQHGYDPGWQSPGSLHLALNPLRWDALRSAAQTAQTSGLQTELLSPDQAARLAPAIHPPALHGALLVHGDGYVDATQYAAALSAAVRDQGTELIRGQRVVRIQGGKGQAREVETDRRTFSAGEIVIAAGPWTGALLRCAGIKLAVCPIRLQQARTEADPQLATNHPVVRIPDQSCYLRPEEGGYLFGFFDPHPLAYGIDQPPRRTGDVLPDRELIDQARRRLSPVFPVLERLAIAQYRQGMVTCTPDGRPMIGPLRSLYGVWVATGCGGMGIAISAAVGQWLGKWIAHGDPGDDLTELMPERFGSLADNESLVVEQCRDIFANYYSLERGGTTYGIGAAGQ
jgi:4-methylaminobutanoate oxidase (formaldehyde-forming)